MEANNDGVRLEPSIEMHLYEVVDAAFPLAVVSFACLPVLLAPAARTALYHAAMSRSQFGATLEARPLAGRCALVTGAARRIGRSIALALAKAGADVIITYHRSSAEAAATVRDLEHTGARACAVACDLDRPEAISTAVTQAAAWAGGEGPSVLDILVNNAGAFETTHLEAISPDQWDRMFTTNTRAPFLAAQAALPFLRASGTSLRAAAGTLVPAGRVINIGSLGGLHPWATHAHYCASKAALHMLTQTMAKAWAPEVAVNCVAPGMIVTGAEAGEAYRHFVEKTPMQRNGTVQDIAEVVLFLARATPFLTGQVIAVDGGLGL